MPTTTQRNPLLRHLEPGEDLAGARSLPLANVTLRHTQPRQSFDADLLAALVADIKERGVLQPIVVRPHPSLPHHWQVVAGEQRTRAALLADLTHIPAIIQDLTDAEAEAVTAQENLLRADLTVAEEAAQYQALMAVWELTTAKELAERLPTRSRGRIERVLRLTVRPDLLDAVGAGQMTFSDALAAMTTPQDTTPPPADYQIDSVEDADSTPIRISRPTADRYQAQPADLRWRAFDRLGSAVSEIGKEIALIRVQEVTPPERPRLVERLEELDSQITRLGQQMQRLRAALEED